MPSLQFGALKQHLNAAFSIGVVKHPQGKTGSPFSLTLKSTGAPLHSTRPLSLPSE